MLSYNIIEFVYGTFQTLCVETIERPTCYHVQLFLQNPDRDMERPGTDAFNNNLFIKKMTTACVQYLNHAFINPLHSQFN